MTFTKTAGPMGPAGADGADGADGVTGAVGDVGPAGPAGATGSAGPQGVSYTAAAEPESCVVCHDGAGSEHQAVYDDYVDESNLEITIDSVSTVGTSATMTVTILKDGAAYVADDLSGLNQARFYAMKYDSATGLFDGRDSDYEYYGYVRFRDVVALGNGQYAITTTDSEEPVSYDIENSDAIAYAYIADTPLDTEGSETLYDDIASAGVVYGDVPYESVANVEGCEKCHGEPYAKHGYRTAEVAGLPDFASCKVCHYDDRRGGHEDWQILANDPARYAEVHAGDDLTAEEEDQYAYTANIMNDVHMSHSMEFPYPQSMSNCATCHEGKLDVALSDANFKVETCKSCHPVTGAVALDPEDEDGEDTLYDTTEFALTNILPAIHDSMDLDTTDCASCHSEGGIAPVFSKIHTGYDKVIYTADGERYSDAVIITIDEASVANDLVTVKFSATETTDIDGIEVEDIVPTVMVGMYGWDTKDYIIGAHERLVDDNDDGVASYRSGDKNVLEYEVGVEHPRGTTVSAADGSWEVVLDMSTWGDLIDDGTVSRLEIAVTSELENAVGVQVAINAQSRTFDLATDAFDDDFYSDIVDVEDGCNTCHDALGTTFHDPDRGGNIVVCRMCHITKAVGSHLEVQSRSIDSYIHAIHSFQAFDIGDVDFENDVLATKYELHVEHTIPTFTAKNCEACHNEGTYEVPDQSKSLPGALSGTDSVEDRNIGDYPIYITGPASRACGGCHRANLIAEDDAVGLASFMQHTKQGGYLIEGGDDDYPVTLGTVIDDIMAYFP